MVSGAIGGLDALTAGSVGTLTQVTYRGRKPPRGWRGSPAEAKLDLDMLAEPAVHFSGSARNAALEYPKNANVAEILRTDLPDDPVLVDDVANGSLHRGVHGGSRTIAGAFGARASGLLGYLDEVSRGAPVRRPE